MTRRATLTLNMDGDNGRFAYRNFVFSKPEEIESISLEIGGQTIDRIYPSLTGDVQFGIFDAIDSLPALSKHDWTLRIRASCCMAFQYDVVHQKEPITTAEVIFSQQQYSGSELVTAAKDNHILLNFNHPVSRIRILSTTPILVANLCLTKDSGVPDQIEVFHGNSANIDIVLNPTINFSRACHAHFVLTTVADGEVRIFADNLQILRMTTEMGGLAYSK